MLTGELAKLCVVARGPSHGAAAIPEEGKWVKATEIRELSGYAHGCGTCAPQMGTCKHPFTSLDQRPERSGPMVEANL